MDIATVLNVEPRYFFESGDDTPLVTRTGQAQDAKQNNSITASFPLSSQDVRNTLHVHRVVIQPNSPPQEFSPYSGEEMGFVLSGELTVVVGNETHTLKCGDSIHYDALLLHSWSNRSDKPCEVIWSRASYVMNQKRQTNNHRTRKNIERKPVQEGGPA
jgi:quercetin dioxygenase-like cupin family protein